MKTTFWTLGLVVLGCILSVANSQYGQSYNSNNNDNEVGYSIQVQSKPLNIAVPSITIQTSNRETQESDSLDESSEVPQVEVSTAGGNEPSSAILLQDSDLSGNAGILVIQHNEPDTAPILYELRPVATDTTDTFFYGNGEIYPDTEIVQEDEMYPDNEVVQGSQYESVEEVSNENRIKPNDDLGDDSNEDYTPQRVRIQRPKKNKQRQSNRNTNLKPKRKKSKRRRRPSNGSVNSGKLRPKRKRRPSRPLKRKRKPIRRRKNKNKNRKGNRKRNQNKRRRPANISSGSHQNIVNRKKNKVVAENSLTKTITTSHTGTADTSGGVVNHIIINKEPAPTTRKPFWRILGRSAVNTEDKSFKLRKRYKLEED